MKKETYERKVREIVQKARAGTIGVTASALSAPQRVKSMMVSSRADSDVRVIKRARAFDDAPNFNLDGSVTDAFKARSVSWGVKERLKRKNK